MNESDNTNECDKTIFLTDSNCCTNKVEFLEIKSEVKIEINSDEDSNKNDDTTEELRVTDFQIPKLEVIINENVSDEASDDNVSKVSRKGDEENNSDETRRKKTKNKRSKALSNCKERKRKLVLKDEKLSSSKVSLQDGKSSNDSSVYEVPILFTDTNEFVNTTDTWGMNPNDDPLDTAQPFTIDNTIFKAQPIKKPFKCKICGKQFHNKSTYRRHVWEHSQSFSCTYCSFQTDRKVQLNAHVNTQHTKSLSYVCDYCNHTSYRKEYLIKHINSKHTKDIYYTCSYCSFKTCQKSYLSKHVNIKHTHKVVYNCTYCEFATCIKNSLTSHVNAEHTKSVAYKCSRCSYKTFYKSYYNKHVKARHREPSTNEMRLKL